MHTPKAVDVALFCEAMIDSIWKCSGNAVARSFASNYFFDTSDLSLVEDVVYYATVESIQTYTYKLPKLRKK